MVDIIVKLWQTSVVCKTAMVLACILLILGMVMLIRSYILNCKTGIDDTAKTISYTGSFVILYIAIVLIASLYYFGHLGLTSEQVSEMEHTNRILSSTDL